ncbi:hypothetical protein R1flu_026835 [Riccia fluitans]|uniref:Tyrosine-specific transport protein n=1 Tax=Riccia fluitans TaxID=41844 RepID=A0ABD1XH31_9MARC
MLPHAASTLSASRFGSLLQERNACTEARKYTIRVLNLSTSRSSRRNVAKNLATPSRRSLKIVVSAESASVSPGRDVPPSPLRDLDVTRENVDTRLVSPVGGSSEFARSLANELEAHQGSFRRGVGGNTLGPHALTLEPDDTTNEFQELHFREVGRKYGNAVVKELKNAEENSPDVGIRTLVSAMALIMGTAVGPGILGLPAATLAAGIPASSFMVIGAWVYVTCSILLVAEISCAVMAEKGQKEVSFTGLVESTLGHGGARLVAMVYASLNYALLVACVAGLGSILHGWVPVPAAGFWSAASAVVVGGLVAFSPFKILDRFNRALCGLMLAAISSLVAIGLCAGRETVASSSRLFSSFSFSSTFSAVPVTVLTLGFHVITPVICKVMKGKPQEARKAILLGGAVPLAMVLAWNGVVLSLAGTNRSNGLDPIKLLLSLNRSAAPAVQAFAFAALGTTLIGYAVSFPKQLADTAQIFSQGARQLVEKERADGDIRPLLWALCPPTLAAILWPTAFASALDFAGVYANCFLFGILPPLMAWIHRYHHNKEGNVSSGENQILVPGGKLLLIVLFGDIEAWLAIHTLHLCIIQMIGFRCEAGVVSSNCDRLEEQTKRNSRRLTATAANVRSGDVVMSLADLIQTEIFLTSKKIMYRSKGLLRQDFYVNKICITTKRNLQTQRK